MHVFWSLTEIYEKGKTEVKQLDVSIKISIKSCKKHSEMALDLQINSEFCDDNSPIK